MAATTAAAKLSSKTVRKAVRALLKWRNSKMEETLKPDLLKSDEFLYLVLTLKKIPPKGRVNAYKISLPNPLLSVKTKFCLIYDDRPKSKYKLTKDQIDKKIKADNLRITKVLKLSKLKSDYKDFESKRKLMDSYDTFLADKAIVELLPRLLGNHFFKKKRIPLPMDLHQRNWKEQVDRIIGSSLLSLSTGTCSVVKVARASMTSDKIAENVIAAVDGIVEIVPRNWSGVRSFHLKLLESLALPVYQAVPDEILMRIEEGNKQNEDLNKEEEVTKKKRVRCMDSKAAGEADKFKLKKAKTSNNAAR